MLLKQNKFACIALALLLCLSYNEAKAQTALETSSTYRDTLTFYADMVNFASDSVGMSRLDVYTRMNFDDVQFIKTDDGKFLGEFEVSASIYDKTDKLVTGKKLKETLKVDAITETASIRNYRLSKLSFNLPPAEYRVSVLIKDVETGREGGLERRITLRDYSGNEMMSSGLLYLEFYPRNERRTVSYVPRLSAIRHEDSNLNAYFEVYNLEQGDSVKVQYEVFDAEEEEKVQLDGAYWLRSSGENVTPSYFEIKGDDLPHGKYITEVRISDASDTLQIEKSFDWLIEGVPLTFSLEEAIETLKYIATDDELDELKDLSGHEKHVAFLEFWEKKDPDPQTTTNDLRRRYYDRIQYANENFQGMQRDGWLTDMGWVYVMLGPPDNINRHPHVSDYPISGRAVKAAEVWEYYGQNRQVVFVDENGFGRYRLVNPQDVYEMLR